MNENPNKPKPSDESTLKCKLVLSQSRIQESLKQPSSLLPALLTLLTYVQCLKYPIDAYSTSWFSENMILFKYFDISYYTHQIPSLACSTVGLIYCVFSVVLILLGNRLRNRVVLGIAKVCQMGFSTIFFMAIVGDNCHAIAKYFKGPTNQQVAGFVLAFFSLAFFSAIVCLQTFTRFDFILKNSKMTGVIRLSNWSGVTLLIYILVNEITIHFADLTTPTHLIIMSISIAFHTFILLIKGEHEEQRPLRMELSLLAINILATIVLMCINLLKLKLDLGLLIIISIISIISIAKVDYFNIVFELQNVNKWTTSQIMISYAAKLRKILIYYDDYYFNVIFLGYVEIHQQKCDNETCPLRNIGPTDETKKARFEDIIKKIYNDGCKLSPVNPELLLEYSIFYYECGAHDKAMKTLLDIKENELTLDKYYKYVRLKNMIFRETSEIPSKDFLDLLSEIKVKDIEEKIIKKFEQSALISLEFWSILNEDHPNFRKLYEIGKSKVMIGQKVHELYKQINKIAHSERITSLYIHYLNLIENEEKMYSQVEGSMKNEEGFENKIVIEDWANNCNPIVIVSAEEENFGSIIDLNTTCATILGHEKFDMVGRDIKSIFPGVLVSQLDRFMNSSFSRELSTRVEQYFYIGYNSGYCLKIKRKLQHYNSIETGLSLIITIENKFIPNSGFAIFNNENQLVTLSSSCIQLLDLEENILENQNYYSDLFEIPISSLAQEKTTLLLESLIKAERVKRYGDDCLDPRHLQRVFNVQKKEYGQFFVVHLVLLKSTKNPQMEEQTLNLEKSMLDLNFEFSVGFEENQFLFFGSFANKYKFSNIELALTNAHESAKLVGSQKKDYSEHITTLRLHENYIKVIEQSSSQNSQGEKQSQTSTNNELIAKANHIPKADEQKIFQSRESYHDFVDKFSKKIYVRTTLAISVIICVGIYIGLYFTIKENYTAIRSMYYRFALGNRIIGELAEANRLIIQTKYYTAVPNTETEWLLIENYNNILDRMQAYVKNYTLPYPILVYIDESRRYQFRSDEFLLAFISQFSKVRADVLALSSFHNFNLDSNSSRFVEINGNLTKQLMLPHTTNFKEKCKDKSSYARNFLIIISGCGIFLVLLLTLFTLFTLKKLNEYKVQLLSVFLQTTEKDIQNFSEKTQNFLVTLHVDESNENNEPAEELFENKKNSPVMFAKKKRFKSTQFRKIPYIILASFFLFGSGYFIHLLAFTIQKNIFIVDAIEYFDVVSEYGNVLAKSQAKIYQYLNANTKFIGSNVSIANMKLSGEINTEILEYERQFFTWHYKTYGTIEEYHQKFATVFMKDVCNGEVKINYACKVGTMAENGTILMLTDFTIQNTQIDYAKPLDPLYYILIQAIKQAHLFLLNEVMRVSDDFFTGINNNILDIMLIWVMGLILIGLILELYIQKVVIKDAYLVRCMLKFFPISFARHSEGVNNYISSIIEQQGSK